jgi:hypothetical protein
LRKHGMHPITRSANKGITTIGRTERVMHRNEHEHEIIHNNHRPSVPPQPQIQTQPHPQAIPSSLVSSSSASTSSKTNTEPKKKKTTPNLSQSHHSIAAKKEEKRALRKKLKKAIQARNNSKLQKPTLDESGRLTETEVFKRKQISSEAKSISLQGADGSGMIHIQYAYCTQRGYYPDGESFGDF